MIKKLLVLGTSIGSVEIVQAAKKMGYYTIVTDNVDPDYSIAKKEAGQIDQPSFYVSHSRIDRLRRS